MKPILCQVEDEAELVLHSYQKMLDTPELVKETLIRLYIAIDDTSMSPELVSCSNLN